MKPSWKESLYQGKVNIAGIDDVVFGSRRPEDFASLEKMLASLTFPKDKVRTLHLKIKYLESHFGDIALFYRYLEKMIDVYVRHIEDLSIATKTLIATQVREFFEWEVFLFYKKDRPVLMYAVFEN